MSYGQWGSRFPVGNIVCSKMIFTMLECRLAWLRFYNSLNRIFSPPKAVLENNFSTQQSLMMWLKQGYNKLNIGGGPKNLEGYINIDFVAYPNVERQVVANILDIAFIPDQCVAQIHSNHVIEHLTREDIIHQLQEWHRILKDGGLLTIRCPNTLGVAYGFWFEPIIESQKDEFIKLGFPVDEDFGNINDRWLHKDFFGFIHWLYGDTGNLTNQHLIRLTPSMLCTMLVDQGFNVLKIAEPEAINIVVVARKDVNFLESKRNVE